MNESFKTDPSLATSARAAKESGSYLCASNVTPMAVRFIVSVFLCLLCSCRMSSTQMTCSHFRKNRPKKRQKPAGCRSRIISKNRPVPIFGRSTGASLFKPDSSLRKSQINCAHYISKMSNLWKDGLNLPSFSTQILEHLLSPSSKDRRFQWDLVKPCAKIMPFRARI